MKGARGLFRPWVVLLLGLAVVAFAQVGLGHARYRLAGELRLTRQALQQVRDEVNRLRLEWASLARPERVRRLASERLHMGPPSPMQVIRP